MTDTKEENREGYARRKAGALDGVRSEPRIYGPYSDASLFQDTALAVAGVPESGAAQDRLARLRSEVDAEIRSGSPEGLRAEAARKQEQRVGQTSTTSAGFTTPQYATDLWAGYRYAQRTIADACDKHPLPPVGLQMNIPSFTGPTGAAQQTELTGVDTASPTGSDIQVSVVTVAADVPLSQQLFDRGGMSGLSMDQIVIAQLHDSVDAQIDLYVWNKLTGGITAAANTITDNSAFSTAGFLADVATARESLADLAGTRIRATHLFSTTDIHGYVTRQEDSQNRPIFMPQWSAAPWIGLGTPGDDTGDGWSGVVLPPGNIAWLLDDNIPAASGNAQLLVSRPSTVLLFESDIIPFAYPQTNATTLTVMVGVRVYVAAAARFPNAHATISGSAYADTEV